MSKTLLCFCTLLLAAGMAYANYVSPHKVGDALSTEDAQAMLSKYASPPQQPWREPDPAKIPSLARYIRASMPFGTQADRPQLTLAQALDIAAYINDDNTPRGQSPNRIKLYTDAALRPQGFAIPAHFLDQPKAYKRAKFVPFMNVNENY